MGPRSLGVEVDAGRGGVTKPSEEGVGSDDVEQHRSRTALLNPTLIPNRAVLAAGEEGRAS
eukprot:297357-Pyramimonas_sp.AAC.1